MAPDTELKGVDLRAGGRYAGILTLKDDTEIHYRASEFYRSESPSGVRFDDPEFGIECLDQIVVTSEPGRSRLNVGSVIQPHSGR